MDGPLGEKRVLDCLIISNLRTPGEQVSSRNLTLENAKEML